MKESHIFGILAFLTGVQVFVLLGEITSSLELAYIMYSIGYIIISIGFISKWINEDMYQPGGIFIAYLVIFVLSAWILSSHEEFTYRPLYEMEKDFLQIHFNIALASLIVSVVNLVQVIRSRKKERESQVSSPKTNGNVL